VIPVRTQEEIQADVQRADEALQKSKESAAAAQKRVAESDGWLRTQKAEIQSIDKKIDVAKKDKQETEKIQLEADKKSAQLVEAFLGKMKSVREAELDLAKTQSEMIQMQKAAWNAELEWSRKRDAAMKAGEAQFRQAGQAALAAQKDAIRQLKNSADKEQDLAGKRKRVGDARLDLFDAREKLIGSVVKDSQSMSAAPAK
jgi:chromosome segregation ATPase